ncbi:hypothetical protein AB0H00_03790 [Nocardia sp. NPDC023852]|uniref:hypothetical protein n=1 Tax=Nocardia sp. NPDC023852 TaxID=3154697 RepID=UPI0033CE5D9A
MIDRSTDAVPEADLAEQSIPAYPDQPVYLDDTPEPDDSVERAVIERDEWSANPADVAEQAIPVPLDDDLEDDLGY